MLTAHYGVLAVSVNGGPWMVVVANTEYMHTVVSVNVSISGSESLECQWKWSELGLLWLATMWSTRHLNLCLLAYYWEFGCSFPMLTIVPCRVVTSQLQTLERL